MNDTIHTHKSFPGPWSNLMDAIYKAVEASPRSNHEQVLAAVEALPGDNYRGLEIDLIESVSQAAKAEYGAMEPELEEAVVNFVDVAMQMEDAICEGPEAINKVDREMVGAFNKLLEAADVDGISDQMEDENVAELPSGLSPLVVYLCNWVGENGTESSG